MSADERMMRLLARLVAGEASDAERAKAAAWMAEHPLRARTVGDLAAASQAHEGLPTRYDSGPAWERVARRTGLDGRPAFGRHVFRPPHLAAGRRGVPSASVRALRRAAAIGALLLLPAVGYQILAPTPADPGMTGMRLVTRTGRGEMREIVLPDRSRVVLGPESRLEYLREGGGNREVTLTGMAFFDVSSIPGRPFLVHTEGSTTRVLGTRFAVRAYGAEPQVRVMVQEGKVALNGRNAASGSVLTLLAGDLAILEGRAEPVVTRGTTSESDMAWTSGRLIFDQAPLPEVITELERWYDTQIELDPSLADRRLTVTVHRGPLQEVLAPIALTLGARIEERGDTSVLLPSGAQPIDGSSDDVETSR